MQVRSTELSQSFVISSGFKAIFWENLSFLLNLEFKSTNELKIQIVPQFSDFLNRSFFCNIWDIIPNFYLNTFLIFLIASILSLTFLSYLRLKPVSLPEIQITQLHAAALQNRVPHLALGSAHNASWISIGFRLIIRYFRLVFCDFHCFLLILAVFQSLLQWQTRNHLHNQLEQSR